MPGLDQLVRLPERRVQAKAVGELDCILVRDLAPRAELLWQPASEAVARDVQAGRAQQGIVCCWTGTGASIAANKVDGVRAALCLDAASAAGARRWNDANVLALSLRATSQAELEEILDAWFSGEPSAEPDDRENVAHVDEISPR